MNKGSNSLGCRSRLHTDVDDCGAGRVAPRALTRAIRLSLITLITRRVPISVWLV